MHGHSSIRFRPQYADKRSCASEGTLVNGPEAGSSGKVMRRPACGWLAFNVGASHARFFKPVFGFAALL
jgi:hypothetical protein